MPRYLMETSRRCLGLAAVLLALLVPSGTARAQWGFGDMMWGYNPENASRTVEAINQRSLQAGQAAFDARRNIQPAANGANSYMNRVRDTDFVGRFDISTRRGVSSGVARAPAQPRPSTPAQTAPAPAPAPAPTVIALATFFDAANRLIWPADAPVNSGLGDKRNVSDQASLLVLREVQANRVASVTSVAEARSLLLDYGRPALQYLRDGSTTQVADGFHRFLLGLYEALGAAALPPSPIPAAPPLRRTP